MRLRGIDSIRFICAIIVVLGHMGGPIIFNSLNRELFLNKIVIALSANLYNGPAAVIVFFVISGMVIHFPYANGKKINISEFYLKRLTRLGIPMLVIYLMCLYLKNTSTLGVFWSLYAELIFYALYPLILYILKFVNLKWLILTTLLVGYFPIFFLKYQNFQNYIDLGNYITWIIGLPVWLLGIYLAQEIIKQPTSSYEVSKRDILLYRVGIYIISVLLQIAKFHLKLSYTISLNLFAFFVAYWLFIEVQYYKRHEVTIIEKGGLWSYSIYICHIISLIIISKILPQVNSYNQFLVWMLNFTFIFIFSFIFYISIEKPSYMLSKRIKIINTKPLPQ